MGERECKIKGYVKRKGIWDREFGNAIWGERGYGKRGDMGIWEERECGNIKGNWGKGNMGINGRERKYGNKWEKRGYGKREGV